MSDDSTRPASQLDRQLDWYENQGWLRAMVQMVPIGGGSIDTLLAWRGTHLNQARVEELIKNLSDKLKDVENKLDDKTLQSEEFFEVFRTCAETAAHSSSESKRERVASFLAGTIVYGCKDFTLHIADDLKSLQDLHFQLIALLPHGSGRIVERFNPRRWNEEYHHIPRNVYANGVSGLERFGMIAFEYDGDDPGDAGTTGWWTTDYLESFVKSFLD